MSGDVASAVYLPPPPLLPVADGALYDPRTGASVNLPLPALFIGHEEAEEALLAWLAAQRVQHLAVVDDANTHAAYGAELMERLRAHYRVTHCPLGKNVHADSITAEHVRATCADADLWLAIGSGTINDLTKYAAHLARKPYAVCATALSMNGYLSANASLSVDHVKHTLPATAPRALLMSLSVLAAAPARLTASGLADVLCRSTAQWDWLFSHYVAGTPYTPLPFDWLAPFETYLHTHAAALAARHPAATQTLAGAVVLSGMGMVLAGGSYPASQAEHMLVHSLEMHHGEHGQLGQLHGALVGVATLIMAERQAAIMSAPTPPRLHYDEHAAARITHYWGAEAAPALHAEYLAKFPSRAAHAQLQERLEQVWPELLPQLRACHVPVETLRQTLRAAGAPTTPEELGYSNAAWQEALAHTALSRRRLTCMDVE